MERKENTPRIQLSAAEKRLIREVCGIQQESLLRLSDINYDITKKYREDPDFLEICDPVDFDLELVNTMRKFERLHKNPSKHLLRVARNKQNLTTIRYILEKHFDNPIHQEAQKKLLLKIFALENVNHNQN